MAVDRKISIFLILLVGVVFGLSTQYPRETTEFPRMLALILLGLSIVLFFTPKDFSNYNVKAIFAREKVISFMFLIGYVFVFPKIGFFVTTFLFLVLYMFYYTRQGIVKYLAVASVYVLVLYFVFQKLLYIWFPRGIFM